MSDMSDKKWRELTFSQREGKAPLPEALQIGLLTRRFRNKVWLFIHSSIVNCISMGNWRMRWNKVPEAQYWLEFIRSYRINVLGIPHDKQPYDVSSVMEWLRSLIIGGEPHVVLSFLEHMFRCQGIPDYLANSINECMEFASYFINQSGDPVYIVPTASEAAKKVVKKSLENVNESELGGAKSHLSSAAQALNNNNYADSIRESVSAVESVVQCIDPKSSKKLSSALNSLAKEGLIKHPALKAAINKLYGYASDEEGIRHARRNKDTAVVGLEEAIFIYTTCVAIVDFLVSKQMRMKEK